MVEHQWFQKTDEAVRMQPYIDVATQRCTKRTKNLCVEQVSVEWQKKKQ